MNAAFSESRSSPCGCSLVGCLGILLGIPLMLVLIGYSLLFHSSLPLKWIAGKMNESGTAGNNRVEVQGISGSISRGLRADKVIVHGESGPSTIEGLTFRYRGFWEAVRHGRLVVKEFSTKRSEILVGADFFDIPDHDESGTTDEDSDEEADTVETSADKEQRGLFEIRKLNLKNTIFRTADGKHRVEFPLVRLEGLKIEGEKFELAELEVVSDVVLLEVGDASPQQIEGYRIPFTRKLTGKVLPKAHPLIRKEIDFTVELAAMEGQAKSRAVAFGGSVTQATLPDKRALVQFNALTVGDFIDPEYHLLPERVTFTIREVDNVVEIGEGEFYLGQTRFVIEEHQLESDDADAAILAAAEVAGHRLESRLRPCRERLWPPLMMTLESDQELPSRELFALAYYHRSYDALSPPEKSRVDGLAAQYALLSTAAEKDSEKRKIEVVGDR